MLRVLGGVGTKIELRDRHALEAPRARQETLAERVNRGKDVLDDLLAATDVENPRYQKLLAAWEALYAEYNRLTEQLSACDWDVIEITWPPGAPIATVNGQWRWLEDGSIVAYYSREQLELALSIIE